MKTGRSRLRAYVTVCTQVASCSDASSLGQCAGVCFSMSAAPVRARPCRQITSHTIDTAATDQPHLHYSHVKWEWSLTIRPKNASATWCGASTLRAIATALAKAARPRRMRSCSALAVASSRKAKSGRDVGAIDRQKNLQTPDSFKPSRRHRRRLVSGAESASCAISSQAAHDSSEVMQRPSTLLEGAGREGLIGTRESEDGRRRGRFR